MNPEDVPIGDRILPGDVCEKCGARLDILEEAGDEYNTLYIGCPDGSEEDGHTHHNGLPAATLEAWGWRLYCAQIKQERRRRVA
jgi:hypothetical protein